MANIDLQGVSITPVGNTFPQTVFFGIFDGNGHVINNVNINMANSDCIGLFGNLGLNGQIRNLALENVTINGRNKVGALAGYNWGGSVINCHSTGTVSGSLSAGGLVGESFEGTIAQSYSSCTVNCTYDAGGLTGYNNNGTITQCYSSGTVSGNLSVGGLTGKNSSGNLNQCHSTGSVNGNENTGGLTGYNNGNIAQCYSTSTVTGENYVGTLVGYNQDGTVTQCYTTGSASGNYDVGALAGYINEGTVSKCYSTGTVSGSLSIGGLAGENLSGNITQCYSECSVTGTFNVGGLVGDNDDIVSLCYSSSTVIGDNSVGGLAGLNGGDVNDCYSTGTVSGSKNYIGGLVGQNNGNMIRCYSTGAVSGKFDVGGLVGCGLGNVMYSLWDMETSGLPGSSGGAGLTTNQMMDTDILGLNGFAGDPNWILDPGNDYPRLAWEGTPGEFIPEPVVDWLEGAGTAENPYQINTAEQLVLLGKAGILWDKHFVLAANIHLDSNNVDIHIVDPNLEDKLVFGQAVIPAFQGVFDGNDYIISNLVIKGGSFLGLFGKLESEAVVRNLAIEDVNITGSGRYIGGLNGYNDNGTVTKCSSQGQVSGYAWVGGLAGYSLNGYITQCYSTGTADGSLSAGGLVGENYKGTINQCYSTCAVSGNYDIGALVGYNWDGSLIQCYCTGTVSGELSVGGLAGENNKGYIIQCFSTGAVTGDYDIGGLAGKNNCSNHVTQSFWDMQTSGKTTSAGGTGQTTSQMKTKSTFTNAGWDFIDETANGSENIWWILEGLSYPRLWWELIP